MKICICDDEPVLLNNLKQLVEKIMDENDCKCEISTYLSSAQLINCSECFDMAFIDIEMPEYKGTVVANKLQNTNQDIFIFFITAFNSYLDEAMDLKAFRFISKPIDEIRLKDSIKKALALYDNLKTEVYVGEHKQIDKVRIYDIRYIEILGRKTMVHTAYSNLLSKKKLDEWQTLLDSGPFYRIHGSFIVNMSYVTRYDYETVVISEQIIPISVRKRSDFKKIFMKFIGDNV